MTKTYFAVSALHKLVLVTTLGVESSVPISWRDGMVGIMPAFDNREAAEAEAGEKYEVIEFCGEEVGDELD